MEKKAAVSIVIPAKNEEHNIAACLQAVYQQETDFPFEVMVIDSGSTDHTVDILRLFPGVRLLQIPAQAFGHGKTRNLGATSTSGADIVFLNADAIPANPQWLSTLITGLHQDEAIAGIFSRHLPKEGCYLYMRRDLQQSMPTTPFLRTHAHILDLMIFSTVSCAIRRAIWQQCPFEENIVIAEDQQWAQTVLQQGYTIAYEPASQVYHSHNYTPRQLYRVKQQVGAANPLFKHTFWAKTLGFVLITGGLLFKLAGDFVYIFFKYQGSLPLRTRLKEFKIALYARFAGFWGRYTGWQQTSSFHSR